MIRLIHNQTIPGAVLIDDLDDGLPNKEVHRLGTTADPKAIIRDGYANKVKQPCYVPYSHALAIGGTVAGFIDLQQTEQVTFSSGKGKIAKQSSALANQGLGALISVVSLVAADLTAPLVTAGATVGLNVQLDGTTFTSVTPNTTTVTFTKGAAATTPSPAVWTQAAIIAAGGSITATQILIPTAAFVGQVVVALNPVVVNANEQNSPTFTTA